MPGKKASLTLTESLNHMFHRSVVLHQSKVAYELVVVSNIRLNRQGSKSLSFRSQRSYSLHYMRIKCDFVLFMRIKVFYQ